MPSYTRLLKRPALATRSASLQVRGGGSRGSNVKRFLAVVTRNGILIVCGLLFVVPLSWLFLTAFDAHASATLRMPAAVTFDHFRDVLNWKDLRPLYNSGFLAGATTILTTATATLAAYGISRSRIRFKQPIMFFVLFASVMPVVMLLVPVYQMYVGIGWIDSLLATSVFLAATSVPFAVWILKNFFDQIPRSYEEAAACEGASSLRILMRIILPLAGPGIAVSAMITFVHAWSAFAIPLVLNTNPKDVPGSIAIYQFLGENAVVDWGPLAAYSLLFTLPVLAVYAIAARHIAGGFVQGGGLKG